MRTKVFAILSVIILLSSGTYAQNSEKKFSIELNSGASLPLSELGGANLNPGFGFEGLFHYRIT